MPSETAVACRYSEHDAPLIAHVIYRLDVGGLENGLVNIINGLPEGKFRHVIICLTDYTEYYKKIRPQVELVSLNKKKGHDMGLYWKLFKTLRRLQPAIIHTRNLGTLEMQVPAWLAGIKHRIHSLHGWDSSIEHAIKSRYLMIYKFINPLIQRYIPLSIELEQFLFQTVGVASHKIRKICNGVDTKKFTPEVRESNNLLPPSFLPDTSLLIGTVGRFEAVKDQLLLIDAFIELLNRTPEYKESTRLVLVGDGSMREQIEARIVEAGIEPLVWLAGSRNDVPELLGTFDVFVLPSKAEGISNTLLEAMASGLPVVATNVGGNAQLVIDGETGFITPKENCAELVDKLQVYLSSPELLKQHGHAARERAEKQFSLQHMIKQYEQVYDELLAD